MEKVESYLKMEIIMKVIFSMIRGMDKEHFTTQMETSTKDLLKIMTCMELAFIHLLMELRRKVDLNKINWLNGWDENTTIIK